VGEAVTRALPIALAIALLLAAVPARADDAQLRVIVPRASIRSGPGPGYREVYRAERGEVLRVVERATLGYWLRVQLPDGTLGWIIGDQALPFEVEVGPGGGPSAWDKIKSTLFAPSPILASHFGMTFSGGALGGDGLFMFRPSLVVDDYFGLEAHVGEAIGQGSLLVYGLDADIFLYPKGPLVPFVALGLGGATSFPKVNGVTQAPITQLAFDAGGGAMLVLRKRLVLRFDFRNYTLFTPDQTQNRQEYSGGVAVFF
jgi:hypothetical protein